MDYFSFDRLRNVFPVVAVGITETAVIVAGALLIGVVLGGLIAFVKLHRIPVLDQLSTLYISFVRDMPEIVLLFIVYFGVPMIIASLTGIGLDSVNVLVFVVIAFGIDESAFLAEMFRAGLQSVPRGQYEAGYATGLTRFQTLRRIVVPQAVAEVLPNFGMAVVALFKNTAIAATIGALDVMGKAEQLGNSTMHSTEPLAAAIIIFVIVSTLIELAFSRITKATRYGRRAVA